MRLYTVSVQPARVWSSIHSTVMWGFTPVISILSLSDLDKVTEAFMSYWKLQHFIFLPSQAPSKGKSSTPNKTKECRSYIQTPMGFRPPDLDTGWLDDPIKMGKSQFSSIFHWQWHSAAPLLCDMYIFYYQEKKRSAVIEFRKSISETGEGWITVLNKIVFAMITSTNRDLWAGWQEF